MIFKDYVRLTQPSKLTAEAVFNPSTSKNYVDFQLQWFGSPFRIEIAHNIKQIKGFEFPVYLCPLCNNGLIVPFPEVETEKELQYWLYSHLFANHIEDKTNV